MDASRGVDDGREAGDERSQASSLLSLRNLSAVRATDFPGNTKEGGHGFPPHLGLSGKSARTDPRVAFASPAVLGALFVLVIAVAASLTLLVIQSRNFTEAAASAPTSTSEARAADTADAATKDAADEEKSETAEAPSKKAGAAGSQGSTRSEDSTDSTDSAGSETAAKESSPPSRQSSSQQPHDTRIDINSADAALLDTVKGIGPATAQKIIDYRTQNGKFGSVEALLSIQGIGAKTLEKMRPQLVAR
jgi:competence protein ComEA